MPFTSQKMGLRIWNLLSDLYDHVQLADNWAKVDYHDHSPGKGVQIPTEGLADGAVTSTKLAQALDPSGAYTTYRNYYRAETSGGWTTGVVRLMGNGTTYVVAAPDSGRTALYINPTDHEASGRATKLRIACTLVTNAVAPAANFAMALYPVVSFGGASGLTPTVGSVGVEVPGSIITFTTPPSATALYQTSGDFPIPAEGWYGLGFTVSANTAANSAQSIMQTLQVRYV